MPTRKLLIAVALTLGFTATLSLARAEEAAKSADSATAGAAARRAPKPKTATGKVGDACKSDDDCSGSLICGKGKCEQDLSRPHPAT
jgi:uncharacterized low-complexity protein